MAYTLSLNLVISELPDSADGLPNEWTEGLENSYLNGDTSPLKRLLESDLVTHASVRIAKGNGVAE